MHEQQYALGLIGLGTMGRNLLLNMADSGFAVAGYDKDATKVDALAKDAETYTILGCKELPAFVAALSKPRVFLLLVPAGKIVDYVIADLQPLIEPGDIIIDGGNSYFKDTELRQQALSAKGIHFVGMGISGGSEGARNGPSMMPGGPAAVWETVKPLFEATAAKVNGEPCVTYLGDKGCGHYVKMVHNGIEYGMMQLISEAYDLMKRGAGFSNDKIGSTFRDWNADSLQSFLIEITAHIFTVKADGSQDLLVDKILDESKQKGTGKWTSQDAMDLQVPIPLIDMAVAMRDLSGYKTERVEAAKLLSGPVGRLSGDTFLPKLKNALEFAFITAYAQGMAQLRAASENYGYALNLEDVARIWRGGCIIRSRLLEDFTAAFRRDKALPNLLLDPQIAAKMVALQADVREVVMAAVVAGLPAPGLMSALSYYDAYRSAHMPANLIQAQRDYFGAHTYERSDMPGIFHTEWDQL